MIMAAVGIIEKAPESFTIIKYIPVCCLIFFVGLLLSFGGLYEQKKCN